MQIILHGIKCYRQYLLFFNIKYKHQISKLFMFSNFGVYTLGLFEISLSF